MRNRLFSFLVPWFMDGSIALVQTAMPLLAVRLGASAIMLGTISWVAQVARLPVCFASGPLSEKWGRKALILPSALIAAIGCLMYPRATTTVHILILYAVTMVSIGAFYPSLQALIGDVSRRGQLTRNLGAFNIGWCTGTGVAALAAGAIVEYGLDKAFYLAAVFALVAYGLVLAWRKHEEPAGQHDPASIPIQDTGPLLLIARLGMFTAFFGYATVRILFPKMGISTLGWTDSKVAWAVAGLPIGQAAGMIATTAAPWWRGKVWPQLVAQTVLLICAALTAISSSAALLSGAFFGIGFALSTAYTAALYHGLSSRREKGKNAGIHESLVAAGGIAGSLIGGLAAQRISPQAPYFILAAMAGACIIAAVLLWRKWLAGKPK